MYVTIDTSIAKHTPERKNAVTWIQVSQPLADPEQAIAVGFLLVLRQRGHTVGSVGNCTPCGCGYEERMSELWLSRGVD